MTPREALHAHCHHCVQSRSDDAVKDCGGHTVHAIGKTCPFYEHRLSTGKVRIKILRRLCVEECMGGCTEFVKECTDAECILYPYRLGRSPAHVGRKVSERSIDALRMRRERGEESAIVRQISMFAI